MEPLVELTIERLGGQGDGIARRRGEAVFVPFTLPGDRVRARLGPRRQGGHEAWAVEWLARGSGRTEPVCRHFARCGGCALQHLGPETYHAAKLAGLDAALKRVGIDPAVVKPLRAVAPGRRRARFGLRRPRHAHAPAIVGFRERFSHAVVDIRECAVLDPSLWALVAPLRDLAAAMLAPGGAVETSLTRIDSGMDMLVDAGEPPGLAALEALSALAADRDIARVVWRAGGIDIPVVERRPARMIFSGTTVPFPPGGFLQASAEAEAMLVRDVLAGIGSAERVVDLHAGLGTFSFALAQRAAVHAVDGARPAVAALAAAAARAGLHRLGSECRDLEARPLLPEELARFDAAVFDPPRAGAKHQAAVLARAPLHRVVAVSCNPASFARDARLLVDGGFRLTRVQPIDQFLWSPHVELVAWFERSG